MATTISVLNYTAFFILYIIGLILLFQEYTEGIGIAFLFMINAAFMVYMSSDVISYTNHISYFVQTFGFLSVIVGTSFHFISLIFIFMLMTALKAKYTQKNGYPFNLPDKYKDKMNQYKTMAAVTFMLCFLVLFFIFQQNDKVNVEFMSALNRISLSSIYNNFYLFLTLILSIIAIGISSNQVVIGNDFLSLSRQPLISQPPDLPAVIKVGSETTTSQLTADQIAKNTNYINLGLFFPPVTNQGWVDSCEVYSLVYYIGNYYQMLKNFNNIYNNFYIDKTNHTNIYNAYSSAMTSYYAYEFKTIDSGELRKKNILNPIYNWKDGISFINATSGITIDRCSAILDYKDLDYRLTVFTSSIIEHGCASHYDYGLNYSSPAIENVVRNQKGDPINATIKNCSDYDDPDLSQMVYPISRTQAATVLFDRSKTTDYSETFTVDNIKLYLNSGYPLLWGGTLNIYFQTGIQKNEYTFPLIHRDAIWQGIKNAASNEIVGVHTMALVGYVDRVDAAKQIDGSDGVFIFINQWGENFATNGYVYITYNFFLSNMTKDPKRRLQDGDGPTDYLIYYPQE